MKCVQTIAATCRMYWNEYFMYMCSAVNMKVQGTSSICTLNEKLICQQQQCKQGMHVDMEPSVPPYDLLLVVTYLDDYTC